MEVSPKGLIRFRFNFFGNQKCFTDGAVHVMLLHIRRFIICVCPTFSDVNIDKWLQVVIVSFLH